ncbi:MAG TPA: ComEC/Rec2 family competence protein, partial [Terriglobales bacterium]|nr:ComEC/Rec2 family competence protein [Terriglobales bacterium]
MIAAAPTRLRAPDGVGRAPLLVAAFAFSAGILFGTYCWRPLAWWLVLAVACAAGAVYLARRRPLIAYALALLLLAALGALDAQLRPRVAGDDLSPYMGGTPVTVTAHVVRDGMMREGAAEQRQSVDVETETLASGGAPRSLRARIRLNLYARGERDPDVDDESPAAAPARQFVYGDRLRFTAKLRPPHNYGNPGSFDYRAYLAERGITALASAGSAKVEPLDGFAGWRVLAWRSALRRRLLERIAALWSPSDAALLSAMLLGETALLDRSLRTEFQRTGVFHILVVSGMNVALLAAVVFWT